MTASRARKAAGGSSTTARGYGAEHQKARARALRELQDGEPCPFCGGPMFPEQELDYDHAVPLAVGGARGDRRLSHASCNRSAGGKLRAALRNGSARRTAPPAPAQTARPAPGVPCYGCGHPMLAGQRLQPGPSAFGEGAGWMHDNCGRRWTSVPVNML